ncbi:glycoside hydrolase family 16 protein [Pseudoduganella sp. SL102]|uniref:glycoside hydrolase family 16 protein n=1 Tax=Pseudoduganella sp. SL102 TaxID=2995154 RepID=UPI00248C3CE6|nr:glycoside hydrolase family 16 protein [Pseudoduganella sp. SL102]WBS03021.1 glycoside hydrolase family 16 protein [Pseudoduganella sp. SL102]
MAAFHRRSPTATGIAAAMSLALLALADAAPAMEAPPGWKLAWADEFDVDGLPDPAKWDYDTAFNRTGWHNRELQYYTSARRENAEVKHGRLVITARKEALASMPDYGGQAYTSARLVTRGKASWTHGFIEVRAKLPCGPGSWPAIWMLGTGGKWPADGEIDIMEHVGHKPGEILGSIYTNAQNWPRGTGKTSKTTVPGACGAFHDYQLTWTNDRILVGVDGRNYAELANPKDGDYDKWPFDRPQYLLLNVAVGGDLGGAVRDDSLPWRMEVEYVRVFQPAR